MNAQPLSVLSAHTLQSLEVAIVGVVLALREALDWVRDSMCDSYISVFNAEVLYENCDTMGSLSKRVLRKLKHMVVNTPAEQRVVSIQEFFESFLGNFMKEEREAAVSVLCMFTPQPFVSSMVACDAAPGNNPAQCARYAGVGWLAQGAVCRARRQRDALKLQ